jgi:hypothetical protein
MRAHVMSARAEHEASSVDTRRLPRACEHRAPSAPHALARLLSRAYLHPTPPGYQGLLVRIHLQALSPRSAPGFREEDGGRKNTCRNQRDRLH